MKQQQQLSPQDWQLLSEYLDGQLSSREKIRLEQRIERQAELRSGLEELRRTRQTLRSARMQRVPRNFTLTPAMVQQPRPNPLLRLVPVLNFASALAGVAVVVTLLIVLLPGLRPAVQQTANPASPYAPAMAAPQTKQANKPTPPVIIQWGYGEGGGVSALVQGQGVGGGGGGGQPANTAPPALGGGSGDAGATNNFTLPPSAVPDQAQPKSFSAEQPQNPTETPALPEIVPGRPNIAPLQPNTAPAPQITPMPGLRLAPVPTETAPTPVEPTLPSAVLIPAPTQAAPLQSEPSQSLPTVAPIFPQPTQPVGIPKTPPKTAPAGPGVEQTRPTQEIGMAPLQGSGPILGARPPQEADAQNRSEIQSDQVQLSQSNSQPASQPNLWLVPVLLGLIAAASALTAWIIKRKVRA